MILYEHNLVISYLNFNIYIHYGIHKYALLQFIISMAEHDNNFNKFNESSFSSFMRSQFGVEP